RASRKESLFAQIDPDNARNRRCKIQMTGFARSKPDGPGVLAENAIAGRQRARIKLEDEVLPYPLTGQFGTGNMEPAVAVGRDAEPARRGHANTWNTGLGVVLITIAVFIIEHLAQDLAAVEL